MKRRIGVLAVLLVLGASAVAMAATNVFSTTNKVGTKVSFKIKTNKKGVAAKVTSIKVAGLPTECLGEMLTPGEKLSVSLRDAKVKAAKNNSGGTFYRFIREQQIGDKKWLFTGEVDKKGRKLLLGSIGVQYKTAGDVTCQVVTDGSDLKKAKRK